MGDIEANSAVLRFDQVFSRMPVGMALIDAGGTYRDVNAAYCSIFGYSKRDLIGNKVALVFPQEIWLSNLEMTNDAAVHDLAMPQEWTALRSDGTQLTVKQASVRISDDHGRTHHVMIATDITKYVEVEESLHIHQVELEMQNEQLRATQLAIEKAYSNFLALYELAPVGYCTISKKGLILQGNRAASILFGVDRLNLLNLSLSRFVHKDHAIKFLALLRELLSTKTPQSCDLRLTDRDGAQVWVHLSATSERDEDGTEELRVVVVDITARLEAVRALELSEERWKFAIEGAGDGVWDWDIQSGQASFSKRWKEMLGFAEGEIQGHSEEWTKRVHPEDMPAVREAIEAHMDRKLPSAVVDYRLQAKDGSYRWIQGRGMVVSRDAQGSPLRLVGTNTDITERKLQDVELRRLLSENRALISAIPDMIFTNHKDGKYLAFEAPDRSLLYVPPSELVGRTVKDVLPAPLADMFLNAFGKALDTRLVQELQYSLSIAGRERWFEARVAGSGKENVITIVRDITERKEMEHKLEQLAFYDPLTTLANRRLLLDRLGQAVVASNRTGLYGAVIFLDLDNFKPLNDLHGHDIGDAFLVEIAFRLKKCVRETDTVGRFGGDEFVVTLVDLGDDISAAKFQAKIVAEKIQCSLAEPCFFPLLRAGHEQRVIEHWGSASIGVALFGGHTVSDKEVLHLADSAMYEAKGAGRNRLHFHA